MNKESQKDYYRKILEKTIKKSIPLIVHWDITYRCNLKCVHCYVVPDTAQKELSLGEIEYILDQLTEAGSLYLVLSGGEIFIRDDFFDIVSYARKRGFALRLFTNGTLITPEVADRLRDLEPLSVEISLYGATPSLHDRITLTPGSFEKTLKGLELLAKRQVRTIVKVVLMKQNVEEFGRLKRLAEEIGSDFLFDLTVVSKYDGDRGPLAYRLSEEELVEFLLSDESSFEWKPKPGSGYNLLCSAGKNNCFISPYGDLYPCIAIKEGAGNLRDKRFGEIWKESEVFSKIRSLGTSELLKCLDCELASFCTRCPGLALLEDGDLFGCSTAASRVARALRSAAQLTSSGATT